MSLFEKISKDGLDTIIETPQKKPITKPLIKEAIVKETIVKEPTIIIVETLESLNKYYKQGYKKLYYRLWGGPLKACNISTAKQLIVIAVVIMYR